MHRRHFLLGLAAAPLLVRRAFADISADAPLDFAGVRRRAVAAGRRIVVPVLPSPDPHHRSGDWGELLVHGSDIDLAPLDAVELVATPVPQAYRDACFVVVEPDGAVRESAAYPRIPHARNVIVVEHRRTEEAIDAARLAAMGVIVHGALGFADGDIAAKAAGVRARYAPPRNLPGGVWLERPACAMGHIPAKAGWYLTYQQADAPA